MPRTKYSFNGFKDTVGNYIEAGLPNIIGAVGWLVGRNPLGVSDGAFTKSTTGGSTGASGNTLAAHDVYFDASDSNSIYGNSLTVQPPATQMYLEFYLN